MRSANKQSAGFSLVELSIVLVILGLLTGGILAGQSLIRAAEMRTVSTDFSRYVAATRAFRDKYFGLPGDITNATSFWGSLGGTGSDGVCQVIAATATATCNGDGNGNVVGNFGAANGYESYRFWQHLVNAGLVEGRYSGVTSSPDVPGTNVPATKLGSAFYWGVAGGYAYAGLTTSVFAGTTTQFAGDYGNTWLNLRTTSQTVGNYPLKPEEAWNIDTKLDDGKPGTGMTISNKGDGTTTYCTTTAGGAAGAADAGSAYKLTNSSKDCWLFFINPF